MGAVHAVSDYNFDLHRDCTCDACEGDRFYSALDAEERSILHRREIKFRAMQRIPHDLTSEGRIATIRQTGAVYAIDEENRVWRRVK